MSISGKYVLGRGALVGNGKVAAICFDQQIILLKNPIILNSSFHINTEYVKHQSGFPLITDFSYPIRETYSFEVHIEGSEGEFITNMERGFIQRLLTEDITTSQMIRLVREKLEKRKI